jgi:3-methyladenine DNA glycosylase AlkD
MQALRLAKSLAEDHDFRSWRDLPTGFVEEASMLPDDAALELCNRLWKLRDHRFLYAASVAIRRHPSATRKVRWKILEPLGNMMSDWGMVDMFASLAGPAWRAGQVSDARVLSWTRSKNRWWRRAALVCTVYLNRKARGGIGDTPRTLAVCEALAGDQDDMVAKGLSWALRDLIAHDRRAVERFIRAHEDHLPALVRREVRSKLTTGRKNPRRQHG